MQTRHSTTELHPRDFSFEMVSDLVICRYYFESEWKDPFVWEMYAGEWIQGFRYVRAFGIVLSNSSREVRLLQCGANPDTCFYQLIEKT